MGTYSMICLILHQSLASSLPRIMHCVTVLSFIATTEFQYISHVHFCINNVKFVNANLDAPDNTISDNESSSEMLTSQS